MRELPASPERDQSRAEETANAISHGLAFVAALVGSPFLILRAAWHADAGFIVGASVFCGSLAILYLSSTLYHALAIGKAKRVFRVIEHSAIFLLIAGTYTPFALGVLRGAWGWSLFGIVWGIAAAGVALKVFGRGSHPILSTGLYLLMGWLVVIAVEPLVTRVPTEGLFWLVAGGLSYTIGVAFFATDARLRYGHFVWHLFVVAGSVCHYFAVYWYGA